MVKFKLTVCSKRAKTEAEKEQRRVERVIRNRNAAHASRERKRVQVEYLEEERNEIRNQRDELARQVEQMRRDNQLLRDQVAQLTTMVTGSNHATPHSFTDAASPTLTPQLFKQESQDPLSLNHVPDHPPPPPQTAFPTPSTLDEPVATPSELTQHPAAMLCSDLQCHSEAIRSACLRQMQIMTVIQSITQVLYLTMISTIYSSVIHPMIQIFISLKWGKPMMIASPSEIPMVLTLTTWLISRPSTTLSTLRSTFRFPLLHRLLTSTPALARPLRDATGKALRLATSSKMPWSSIDRQDVVEQSLKSLMSRISAIDSGQRSIHKRSRPSGLGRFDLYSYGRRDSGRDLCNRRMAKELYRARQRVNNSENVNLWRPVPEQFKLRGPKDNPDLR
jgi:transcriptional activator HAC1